MAEDVETVVTETPAVEAPIGKDAFKAAREEIRARSQSQDQGSEPETPETDDTPKPDAKPSQQPETPADETPETGETEDALLTPDEVSKLSAADKKLYAKAQKNYTQKTQKLAAERREFEEQKALHERQLAERQAPPVQDTKVIETQATEALATLPEEWQFLKPLFETYGKQVRDSVLASVKGELEPIKQTHMEQTSRAVAAETNATLEAFTAKHPDWKKYETRMVEEMSYFAPGALDDAKAMEKAYRLATADLAEAQRTRTVVDKINKAAENAEPVTQGIDSSRVEHVMPEGLNESGKRFRAAAAAAKRKEVWVTRD